MPAKLDGILWVVEPAPAMQSKQSLRHEWLRTGDESFQALLRGIGRARRSIRFETYIYADTPIGQEVRSALVKACNRGVRVRVLIDAWGSLPLPDSYWDPFRAAGGEFRWFNPLSLSRASVRNHRKLLVCDDELAIIGGFNISTEYQGDGVTRGWYDLGMALRGPLARELAASFDTIYELAEFKHKRFPRFRRGPLNRQSVSRDGHLILSGPGRGQNPLKDHLIDDLNRCARARIICAYFLPTRPIRLALTRAARRGARIQIILAGKTDVPLVRIATRRIYSPFLRAGIELFEYQPQVLHAKMFLIDRAVYVGSSNLDRRSLYINYELMVRLESRETAAEANAIFDQDLLRCRQIPLEEWRRSRTFFGKLFESWAYFILARLDPFLARSQLRHLR